MVYVKLITQPVSIHHEGLTIPMTVNRMTRAKQKNATKALAFTSGCLFWNTLIRSRPPMMNMKAVSESVGVRV